MQETALTHPIAADTVDAFIESYGGIYEESPWIAQAAWGDINAAPAPVTTETLHGIMKNIIEQAGAEKQKALICAHPDLACAPAEIDKLSQSSTEEQKGAGLNACTAEEFEEFQYLNKTYREKFGFPFIIAVRGLTRQDILSAFRARVNNTPADEFRTALDQIHKIALLRLCAMAEAA